MDFLNKSLAQLKDLFLSMTPGARITAALLLVVVVVSLGYLFTYEIAGPEVYLLSGEMFSSSELNNMATAFSQEGLDSYEIEGNKIRVPRNQRDQYMAALGKHNALPEEFDDILARALESGSAWMSPSDRETRLKIARQKYLSRMLSQWPGIEQAHVIYDTRRRGGLSRETVATASVHVKPRGNNPLDRTVVSSIRMAMGKAIPGLEPEDCAVTDLSTMHTTVGTSGTFGSPNDDADIARQRYYEDKYKHEIVNALGIPGATVMAFAVLSSEKTHRQEEHKVDPKGTAAVQQSETSAERTVESAAPAGRPGFIAQNAARSLASTTAKGSTETETQTESTQQSLVSTTKTLTETAGLVLEQVAVTVTVPTSYYEQVWRRDNPPQAGEEGSAASQPQESDLEPIRTRTEAEIKELVATIIPKPKDGTDPKDLVTVAEFPDVAPPEIPEPGIAENVFVWLGNYWSTVGLIGLAFFSLAMLRSMIRAVPAAEIESRAPALARTETVEEQEEESKTQARQRQLKRFSGSGASLRDELSELVNEDPDTAANILRNWIGTGPNR